MSIDLFSIIAVSALLIVSVGAIVGALSIACSNWSGKK